MRRHAIGYRSKIRIALINFQGTASFLFVFHQKVY